MVGRRRIIVAALGMLAFGAGAAHAADTILLKRFGSPKTRIRGGTRSGRGQAEALVLLSEETALSAADQPDLYWFLAGEFGLRIEVELAPVSGGEPLLSLVLKRGVAPGLHRLALADHGVRLEAGTDYVFAVTLVPDPTMRAADSSARGTLRHQPHPPFADARAAAAAGYWIDAFQQADAATRAALLKEVGLPLAASQVT